jgi:hypothetical protein
LKAALALVGLGAVAAAAGLFLFFRKKNALNVESGSTPLGSDVPEGEPTGKIIGLERNVFTGFEFRIRVENPASLGRTVKLSLDFMPHGGLQFGVDPFHAEQTVTMPARASVEMSFTDEDLSFAPVGGGTVTLSIDGKVVDRQ